MSKGGFVFDWYQATVPQTGVQELRDAMQGVWSGLRLEQMNRAPHGYASGHRIHDADDDVGFIWSGGMHAAPHVVFTSGSAVPGAQLLRSQFPQHRPTRVDPCRDHVGPGSYDRLQDIMVQVAKERRIKVGTAGDHLVNFEGRSCMLGSGASAVRGLVYEKSFELRQKFANRPDVLATVPDDLARLEFRIRPQTAEARQMAAVAEPLDLVGGAAWARELMARVDGIDLAVFPMCPAWRPSDRARAYGALLNQYGPLLGLIREDLGSWAAVGAQLGADIEDLKQHKKRMKGR